MKKRIFSALLAMAMLVSLCPTAFAAAETGVTQTAYHSFYPNTNTYNTVSGYESQTGNGTVVLTEEVPTASDYAYTWYYGSHYLGWAKGYTWITVKSSNPSVATATAKTGTHSSGKPCLQVDFSKGSATGATTITVEFTVTELHVESGIAQDSDTAYAVNGRLVYSVSNSGGGGTPDVPDPPTEQEIIDSFFDSTYGALRVQCVGSHSAQQYVGKVSKLKTGSFSIGPVHSNPDNRGDRFLEEFPYRSTITVNEDYYVDLYNRTFPSLGEHALSPGKQDVSFSFYYFRGGYCTYADQNLAAGWYCLTDDAPVRVTVSCRNIHDYSLTYSANCSETLPVPSAVSKRVADTSYTFDVDTTELERSGYTFLGWALTPDAVDPDYPVNGVDLTVTATVSQSDIKLYAVWEMLPPGRPGEADLPGILEDQPFVTVFCGNDEMHHTSEQYAYIAGSGTVQDVTGNGADGFTCDVTLAAEPYIQAYNHTHPGHSLEPSLTQDAQVTLVWDAQASAWTLAPTNNTAAFYTMCQTQYTLQYASNGGGGSMEGGTYPPNAEVTVSANGFTPPKGTAFDGWNTVADGSGTAYRPGDKFHIAGNVTLYAQWATDLVGGETGGDGIPDQYQVLVTWKAVNATFEGGKAELTEYLTLMKDGVPAADGAAAIQKGKPVNPDQGFTLGAYDKTFPLTIREDTTITYTAEKDQNGDEIPDRFQVKVTWKAVNATFEGGKAELTEYLTLMKDGAPAEDGAAAIQEGKPVNPDQGFTLGAYDKTFPLNIREDTTITYTAEKDQNGDEIPDRFQVKVTWKAVNATFEGGKTELTEYLTLMKDGVPAADGAAAIQEGKPVNPDQGFTLGAYDKTFPLTIREDTAITYTAEKDQNGDEIPDRFQVKVTWKAVNATFDGGKTVLTEYLTLMKDGVPAADGLAAIQEGKPVNPNQGFTLGAYDKTFPLNIREDTTITYTAEKDQNGDEIPDRFQVKVTWKAVNATFDGGKTELTEYLTLMKDGVPAADGAAAIQKGKPVNPDQGFTLGAYDKTFPLNIREDTTITYTAEKDQNGDEIPDRFQVKVTWKAVNATFEGGKAELTEYLTLMKDGAPAENGAAAIQEGKPVNPDQGFTLGAYDKTFPLNIREDTTITYTAEKDQNGDEIPDRFQVKVTFQAGDHGTVSFTGPVFVTLLDATGNWSAKGTGYLRPEQISAAEPEDGYKLQQWSPAEPTTEYAITKDTVFTAVFQKLPELNKGDHFAYINGYPDGSVHPNGNITREEVAAIFYRLLTDESRAAYGTASNPFSDVSGNRWSNRAISTLVAAGILKGYPDGTFRPGKSITRAELAVIVARFAKLTEGDATFLDIAGHWAESYISMAAANGWIKGYPDGTFRPNKPITRAETVTLINRVLERNPESKEDLLSDMRTFTDNMDPQQWYYLDIQEAANSHLYQRKDNGFETWLELRPDPDWSAS